MAAPGAEGSRGGPVGRRGGVGQDRFEEIDVVAGTAGTVIYLVLCVSIATIMAWVERRTAIPGLIAGGHRR